jgi:two-component system chemotaxis family response regulator WspR
MPGTDGLALVHQYRTSPDTKDVPIIVLSTSGEPEVKCEAFARGASDYLVKLPATIELLARIRYHSKAYLTQIQRDEAYQALHESQALLLEKNFQLALLTNVDGLTGLSNRRHFDELLAGRWRQAIRERTPCSMLMIDVDSFKRYNDTYGHLAGDEALKQVADAIRTCCKRPTDLAARFGGEEFIVCFSVSSPYLAQAFAETIRAAVEAAIVPHAGSVTGGVTVSIGVAWAEPRHGELSLALIEAADVALYEAKRSGKNRTMLQERHRPKARVTESSASEHPSSSYRLDRTASSAS